MKKLETITEIKEKLNKGKKLNCSETHVLIEFINNYEKIKDIQQIKKQITELQHYKDTTVGLYATDKIPEKLFEEVFVNLIEEIGMDGEKTFSPMDYEYYRDMFNRGMKLIMWRIS